MSDPMSDERLAQFGIAALSPFPFDHPATQVVQDAFAELAAEAKRARGEERRLRAQLGDHLGTDEDDDVFEPGHTYRSENGYFEFHCERRIDGIAFGIETVLKAWPVQPGQRFRRWANIGPSVGYRDVTEELDGGA